MKPALSYYSMLSLIATTFFITSMDKPLPMMTVKEITAVQNPCKVAFAENGELMIGDDQKSSADSGLYLANWKENKTLRTVFKGLFLDPYCFRNQQRNAIIANPIAQIAAYDLEGHKIYECNRKFCTSTSTANGTIYSVEQNGTTHNNKNNTTFHLPCPIKYLMYPQMTAHNNKEWLYFAQYVSKYKSRLYKADIKNDGLYITHQDMPILSDPSPISNIPTPYHSPINETMALYWPFKDTWSLYDPVTNQYLIEDIENGLCRLVAFHPKKYHLLGLITKDGFVKLYNTSTQTIIASTNISLGSTTQCDSFNYQQMDFSADGKYLAVTFDNKCFVLSNFDQYID